MQICDQNLKDYEHHLQEKPDQKGITLLLTHDYTVIYREARANAVLNS